MSADKKRLETFEHNWQADAVKILLAEKQIAYYEIVKPRDYVSIAIGAAQGGVELYVDEQNLAAAQDLLRKYRKATALHAVSDMPGRTDEINLKKSIGQKLLILLLGLFLAFEILWYLRRILLN